MRFEVRWAVPIFLLSFVLSGCPGGSSGNGGGIAASPTPTAPPSATPTSTPTPTPGPTPYAFCGGAGTAGSPYLICTSTDLQNISQFTTKSFKLSNDIILNGGSPTQTNFTGLGNFYGVLDGDNHTVTGMSLSTPLILFNYGTIRNIGFTTIWLNDSRIGVSESGLVASNNGTITNLTISNAVIVAATNTSVGGIAGFNSSMISSSSFSGEINGRGSSGSTIYIGGITGFNTGTLSSATLGAGSHIGCATSTQLGAYVGGLVGINYSGNIQNSSTSGTASVTCGTKVGGIAGSTQGGTISKVQNSAAVSTNGASTDAVGGVVGHIQNPAILTKVENNANISGQGQVVGGVIGSMVDGVVSECINHGNVSAYKSGGTGAAGGVAGQVFGEAISRCYTRGVVDDLSQTGTACAGIFVGRQTTSPTHIYNVRWLTPGSAPFNEVGCSGVAPNAASKGLTSVQYADQSFFVNWDFTNIWIMGTNYPTLR